jgi:hypothetical protein
MVARTLAALCQIGHPGAATRLPSQARNLTRPHKISSLLTPLFRWNPAVLRQPVKPITSNTRNVTKRKGSCSLPFQCFLPLVSVFLFQSSWLSFSFRRAFDLIPERICRPFFLLLSVLIIQRSSRTLRDAISLWLFHQVFDAQLTVLCAHRPRNRNRFSRCASY